MIEKTQPYLSVGHRRLVAALDCVLCGASGQSQAAHPNYGKGMGLKSCDSLVFPMCGHCHTWLDQSGKLDKTARRNYERSATDKTRAEMMRNGTWAQVVEAAYKKAVKWEVNQ